MTKSGTNRFNGTGYFFSRSESLVGQIASTFSTDKTKVGLFNDRQGGASFGGPIVKNKAFFFANVDIGRKATPNGFSASGTTGQPWGHTDEVNRIVAIAKGYGYDPGSIDEFSKRGTNQKVFVRTDFNLSPKNQLTVRTNYIDSLADQSGTTPSSLIYILPGNFYAITGKTSTTVGQLNSTWNTAFNEFRVTYQRQRDLRDPGQLFPHVQVDISGGANVRLGAELSSQQNRLDQDVVEATDDFTWLKGTHTFTFGTHNEFFKFLNVFVQNYYGQYRFSSIDNFAAGIAQGFNHNFSNTADPIQPAQFAVRQFGAYAGDQWRVKPNLTLTYGVRFDMPNFPDVPNAEPAFSRTVRLSHRHRAGAEDVLAPDRVQLGHERRLGHSEAAARRDRLLRRPHAVRLAVEPVQQQRRRFHGDCGGIRDGHRPDPIRRRSEQPANQRAGRYRRQPDAELHRPQTTSTRRCCAATWPTITSSGSGAWSEPPRCCSATI